MMVNKLKKSFSRTDKNSELNGSFEKSVSIGGGDGVDGGVNTLTLSD